MSAQCFLYELMGMPKYLLDYHDHLHSDALETALENENPDEVVKRYYNDDQHITAAVVDLHPLLDPPSIAALRRSIQSDVVETIYELDKRAPEPKVHLVLSGSLRLVAKTEGKKPIEIGQCRPGQWLGLPSALREFDEREANKHWVRPIQTSIEAIPFGRNVSTVSIHLSDFVNIMRQHDALVRYVRNHVSIRFARRDEILGRLKENPICRLLPPADLEYLMQLGTIRRAPLRRGPEKPSVLYLAAGKPSRRVSLILSGQCTSFAPGADNNDQERYVGKFEVADLLGHEALVMPEEKALVQGPQQIDETSVPAAPQTPDFEIREANRFTNIYASPGVEVMEFFWYAFRWTLDDRMCTWSRIVNRILSAHNAGDIPEIIAIQASRRRLGMSTLAQGLAVTLAHMAHERVCILDLQGADRFEHHFKKQGFTHVIEHEWLQPTVRARRSRNDTQDERTQAEIKYARLVPPRGIKTQFYWPEEVEMIWPLDPNNADETANLVELLQCRDDLQYVILCMRQDAQSADKATKDVAMALNSRCSLVLYVTDETEKGYQFSEIEPPRLVWVERMTSDYMKREEKRMKQAMNEARYGGLLSLLPKTLRKPITNALGGFPGDDANTDFTYRRQIVRVPDDPEGSRLSNECGPHAIVGPGAKDTPFKRALERLGRVVTRQTVGVALGGGGAWGFCHVALLQNLEEQRIPIDYITGTSFGSFIGGLYAAGGNQALRRLIEENSLDAQNPLSPMLALLMSPLMRTILLAAFSPLAGERFINEHLRRSLPNHPKIIGLGMTEIPFYPISSNLTKYEERTEEHTTIGHGVRLSGTAPPMTPAFRLRKDLIVDGAFVANVPSRFLREIGADFVIAANAVPPPPEQSPEDGVLGQVFNFVMARFNDAMRANQLLTWKSGEDQGKLYANCACDLRPKDSNFIEMWKGRAIMDQVRRDHFSGAKATSIRELYQAFCDVPWAQRVQSS